jgi:hypothetical protein
LLFVGTDLPPPRRRIDPNKENKDKFNQRMGAGAGAISGLGGMLRL